MTKREEISNPVRNNNDLKTIVKNKEISNGANGVDCIFCNIKSDVYENDNFVVVKDINPKTETHLLIIPKKHIESINHLEPEDKDLMGEMIFIAQKVAQDKNLESYNLRINVGRKAGQVIDHIHMHLLNGKKICH